MNQPGPVAANANADEIRALPHPHCCLCGAKGKPLYEGLRDRLFGAPGQWNLVRCPNLECGLLWLDPMPLEEDIGRAYRDYYTHEEDEARESRKGGGAFKRFKRTLRSARETGYLALRYGSANGASVPQKLAGLLVYLEPARKAWTDFRAMYLPVRPGGRLLEIGCGSGHQLEFLQRLGWQVEGLDPDPAAVSTASARGLTVHAGSLEAQHFPDRYFDAVVSSHVIEHVHDPVGLLRECGRILRPGGRLVVVTPNSRSWGHRWFGASWLHLDPPRHLHLFNPVSLRRAAGQAGVPVLRLTSTVRDADGLFRASRDIRDSGHHVWGSRHPQTLRRWSKALQWVEWLLLQVGLDRGEDLVMICAPNSGREFSKASRKITR